MFDMNQIIHGDSYEILPTLPDKSFDTVIIDPPYGMGIDEWDTPVDVEFFTKQIKRIGKEFYAVFGQMPYIREWDRQAEKHGFHFMEHITWVKRNGIPSKRLYRNHEELFIYAIENKRDFYNTHGKYEDVKVPGLMFDVIGIEGIQRYIADMHCKLKGNFNGDKRKGTKSQFHHKSYTRYLSGARSDEFANFSNVWSFLPESLKTYNKASSQKFHCTMKPMLLSMRLVEMLTSEKNSVLDCFSGSGTTALSCHRLERPYLCIEKESEFHQASVERLKNDRWQPELEFTKATPNKHLQPDQNRAEQISLLS